MREEVRTGGLQVGRCLLGLLCAVAVFLLGCVTAAQRLDRTAASSGLEILNLDGGDFRLRAYSQNASVSPASVSPESVSPASVSPASPDSSQGQASVLHVYLEGDGRPWVSGGTRVATDPHGDRNLAFELMRIDPAPSLYLKRPCYQDLGRPGRASAEGGATCHPLLWTHQRYSEAVIDSMASALRSFLAERPAREVSFFGYSGGGVLAMLLAPQFSETTRVVTIAANLDVAAWTELHGYTPLVGSLDPSRRPPLPSRVEQLHLVGELDRNVPPDLVQTALEGQESAEVRVVEGYDHVCCWREIWPEILRQDR